MLTELKLRGFKAVYSARLPLDEFTLLIGRNGSGKSTALEALQWLRDSIFIGLDAATGAYTRYAHLLNRRSQKGIALDLKYRKGPRALDVHYVLSVEASSDGLHPLVASETCTVGRTNASRTVIRSRHGKRGPTFRWISARSGRPLVVRDDDELGLAYAATAAAPGASDLRDFFSRAVFLRLSPTALAAPARAEPRRWSPILSEDGSDLPLLLERLNVKARSRLVARVGAIFDDVKGLEVKKSGSDQYFVLKQRMRSRGGTSVFDIPSWMLAEGMRRIVAIFALLEVEPRPSLLAIEEIENGLDPWTLEHVLQALQEASEDIQILLTSHSPFLLDHLHASDIIHVQRVDGDTTYAPITTLPQVAKFEGVLAPGAMYLSDVFRSAASNEDSNAD